MSKKARLKIEELVGKPLRDGMLFPSGVCSTMEFMRGVKNRPVEDLYRYPDNHYYDPYVICDRCGTKLTEPRHGILKICPKCGLHYIAFGNILQTFGEDTRPKQEGEEMSKKTYTYKPEVEEETKLTFKDMKPDELFKTPHSNSIWARVDDVSSRCILLFKINNNTIKISVNFGSFDDDEEVQRVTLKQLEVEV